MAHFQGGAAETNGAVANCVAGGRTCDGVMKGTDFGPMAVPDDPSASNLLVLKSN